MDFKNWLTLNETNHLQHRGELEDIDMRKEGLSIGDIVELGPEITYKGEKVGKIGRVIEIRYDTAVIQDLTRSQQKRYVVPIANLYNKEDLKGRTLLPKEEKELAALGGKTLWVNLTPRQYKKYKGQYEAEKTPEIASSSYVDEPSDILKQMFGKKEPEPEQPRLNIFDLKPDEPGETQPLKKFLASRRASKEAF